MRAGPICVLAVAFLAAGCGKDAGHAAPGGGASAPAGGSSAPAPEAFWGEWRHAVGAADGAALWRMTCASNRRAIVERTRAALGTTPDAEWARLEELTAIPGKDLRTMSAEKLAEVTTVATFRKLREQPGELEKVERSSFLGCETDGDRGRIRFRIPDGREMSLVLVLEEGEWKADLEASARPGGGK